MPTGRARSETMLPGPRRAMTLGREEQKQSKLATDPGPFLIDISVAFIMDNDALCYVMRVWYDDGLVLDCGDGFGDGKPTCNKRLNKHYHYISR